MSREGHASDLRLLGAPVSMASRGRRREDKIHRGRPRSALLNSALTPEPQDRYRRPFSADPKDRHSAKIFLNALSVEPLGNYNNAPNNVKIVAPTTELLGDKKPGGHRRCGGGGGWGSDHGSEDTFVSLGAKIKARAQSPQTKNHRNLVKYRNHTRKGKKIMDSTNDKNTNVFDMQVKIIGKENSPTRIKTLNSERCNSPYLSARPYPASPGDALAGRVSFGDGTGTEIEHSIDTYAHRLSLSKQQLSLVEEESTQDLDSIPSQNASSLSPENSLHEDKNMEKDLGRRAYATDAKNVDYPKLTQNFISGTKSYNSFYDDFQSNKQPYKNKMSSTFINVDTASKDSGYTDSGTAEEGGREDSTPTPVAAPKNNNLRGKNDTYQSKSLESIPFGSQMDVPKLSTFEQKKHQWNEPLNHSRLLYKEFFLQKEGHIAKAPQNSPVANTAPAAGTSDLADKSDGAENTSYPSYLQNSNTKAYTSKVIEDYKKEIAAINNLHELTIKDLKTDAVSPTPLDIDKLFDPSSLMHTEIQNSNPEPIVQTAAAPTTSYKKDISEVSTNELIQNYLKVKEGDYSKNYKKCDKKNYNALTGCEGTSKSSWSNKTGTKTIPSKISSVSVPNRNQNKNIFTLKAPLSARIDSVQNDKDIESWISIAAPSPNIEEEVAESNDTSNPNLASESVSRHEVQNIPIEETKNTAPEIQKSADMKNDASVLDIYSMLKEIESFGENPVQVETKQESASAQPKPGERIISPTPKDNFLEIFQFLDKVEQSASEALAVVTDTTPHSIPKLELLLKLPQTELAQRLVTASLQLEERSCCISLLQESLANHKEQMVKQVSNLEKASQRSVARVKQDCEDAIKRHQAFIDQLINDKKTLNHRIEQLVDERRALEERWRRAAAAQEQRFQLELRNQHDRMLAAQQLARQRWVRQKAEKIKELTVKGLEGELREMAERQQQEVAELKMQHAEELARVEGRQARAREEEARAAREEAQAALLRERQLAATRLEQQILELEAQHAAQRTRLVAEMRAGGEQAGRELAAREARGRAELAKWKEEQEQLIEEKRKQLEEEIAKERNCMEDKLQERRSELEAQFEQYKKDFEAEQQMALKRKTQEIAVAHKVERDRDIERALEALEAEAEAGRRALQDQLRGTKEQYLAELAAQAGAEQAARRRARDAAARAARAEDRGAELEIQVNHLETRNKVLTEKNIELDRRISEIRASCDESWAAKIELMKKEAEEARRLHDEQMHQLYAKVKVAVARKDGTIGALTRDAARLQEKAALLEQKLQQQRKDFLKHK